MYNSSFFLGYFVGPTIAGITVEYYGFPKTTVGFLVAYLIILMLNLFESVSSFCKIEERFKKCESSEYISLISNESRCNQSQIYSK